MISDSAALGLLQESLRQLDAGFDELPAFDSDFDAYGIARVLQEVAARMRDNYPYQHPLYAGQMLKPPHAVARLAYSLAMLINPNNHALDGGRASSAMEQEAVAEIAAMYAWEQHLGHLTSGGTMANLEALWVAGCLEPGRTVVASALAHYTHERLCRVLKLPFEALPVDERGRMRMDSLAARLERGDVGCVVATLGTTATGAVDQLPEILALGERYDFRLHVDAAYGGYFGLASKLDPETREAFARLGAVDSLVVDPHKHGLQPYGCGCVLFRDPSVGRFYKHDSPYTYFTSTDLHLGEISLECSRPGAAAVALWATQRLMPLKRGGVFAAGLDRCREAALALHGYLAGHPGYLTVAAPQMDIVVWAPRAESSSRIGERSRQLFQAAARENLHLALAGLPAGMLRDHWPQVEFDGDEVLCLRSCLMKPEHLAWADRICGILDGLAKA